MLHSKIISNLLLAVYLPVAIVARTPSLASIEPAATIVPISSPAGAPLQKGETLQLTDDVVKTLFEDEATSEYAEYFAFEVGSAAQSESLTQRFSATSCKTFPGDSKWPKPALWDIFDALLGESLIHTVPIAAPCYDTEWGPKSEATCAAVIANFTNPLFHADDETSIMWPIFQSRTCMPTKDSAEKSCTRGGYPEYAIRVTNVAQIQLAINFARNLNLRLVIKNTGHCYLGKSSGAGALSLWTHNMKDIDFLPNYKGPGYSGPALKLAAGVTVREVYEAADKNGVTVLGAVSWSVGYAGGMITGGGQNPLAGIYGMASDHVVAFQLVTAAGRFIIVSEESNPDLFWALRGGGGGTFGVVVSVIIRAHPKLDVVTSSWTLDATANNVDAYWAGVRKFYNVFLDWTDAGFYSFHVLTKSSLTMTFLFAPNHTESSYARVTKPFFDYLDTHHIILSKPHNITSHTSFYSAYQTTWGGNNFPIGTDTSLPANRIVPRVNFEEKFNQTYAVIKEHVIKGRHFLGWHNAPKKYANTNNAVSPAWRECVMFLVTSSNRSLDHSTPKALSIANADLQENILQPWRDISPVSEGGGTYLNEASVEEADWQESFYGGYYPRLSEIKKTWDPYDVFYATTAVGSERWTVEDGNQGVQTQNGKLCRV